MVAPICYVSIFRNRAKRCVTDIMRFIRNTESLYPVKDTEFEKKKPHQHTLRLSLTSSTHTEAIKQNIFKSLIGNSTFPLAQQTTRGTRDFDAFKDIRPFKL